MTDSQQALLFGGQGSAGALNDTWVWKAGCWTRLMPKDSPPRITSNPAMAYDESRHVAIMYGDYWGDSGPADGTWTWDGTDWKTVSTAGPQLVGVAAYDPQIQRVVLFAEGQNLTWSWDGAGWQKMQLAAEPGFRGGGVAMAFDSASQSLILFGGIGPSHEYLAETWSLTSSSWVRLAPSLSPPGRAYAAISSFASKRQVLLAGGENGAILTDSWVWNGNTWASIASFGPRNDASAIDIGSGVLVFGGESSSQAVNDLWLWDGSTWSAN